LPAGALAKAGPAARQRRLKPALSMDNVNSMDNVEGEGFGPRRYCVGNGGILSFANRGNI
jgi:hypothetical protein